MKFSRVLSGYRCPVPVIGLVLLVVGAMIRARIGGIDASEIEDTDLGTAASALLSSLGLLFVPAGVGIVANKTRAMELQAGHRVR